MRIRFLKKDGSVIKSGSKRFASVAMAALLGLNMFMLTGCGENTADTKSKSDDGKYHIGICQLVEHSALDTATDGFVDALNDEMGDKVVIDREVADGTAEGCDSIIKPFVEDKYDLIMANATTAMTTAYNDTGRIPIVATSITDYSSALNIRNWTGYTGVNVTGTSDFVLPAEMANVIFEIMPTAKKIGLMYCSKESNSLYQINSMKTVLEEKNIEYELYPVEDASTVEATAYRAAESCDAIYIPTDNLMASQVDVLKKVFVDDEKVPMFAAEEGLCEAGLATITLSYYDIGYKAGKMAVSILTEDTNPANMEIQYADEYTKKYNAKNAQTLGITVPSDYVAIE